MTVIMQIVKRETLKANPLGHSQADKAKSRERILTSAAKQIREAGLDGVAVADLMKSAGLTHGAFYSHFESRAHLVAAALERALVDGEERATASVTARGSRTVKSIVNSYLSKTHRDDPGSGCAVSALVGDVGRSEPVVRSIMATELERYFDRMAEALGDGREADRFAVSAWATMIGAIMMSRVFAGEPRADEILTHARKSILELEALHKASSETTLAKDA